MSIPDIFKTDQTELVWKSVRMNLLSPYFHVLICPRSQEEGLCGFTTLLSDIQHLQLASCQAEVVIEEVQLVSPGHMNGSGRWRMDRLDSIHIGSETSDGAHWQLAYVYVLSNGERYLDSALAESENELRDIEKVFPAPNTSQL